ncbi:MAG: hypothetical protein LBS90_08560 [Oscillospiraceae bacterium]|jgi:hypothetical protein|nr:hypothetical protein [Oscillospiraceae bacterium]
MSEQIILRGYTEEKIARQVRANLTPNPELYELNVQIGELNSELAKLYPPIQRPEGYQDYNSIVVEPGRPDYGKYVKRNELLEKQWEISARQQSEIIDAINDEILKYRAEKASQRSNSGLDEILERLDELEARVEELQGTAENAETAAADAQSAAENAQSAADDALSRAEYLESRIEEAE